MVTITNMGIALKGMPIYYHLQTGALLTNYFEIILYGRKVRPYERRAAPGMHDISIPSRVWVFSPRENEDYSYIIVYDFENCKEIKRTDNDVNLVFSYDYSSPIVVFNEWGEKYCIFPLNARRGRSSIWGYGTLDYSRIAIYWSYQEMYMYAWEDGLSPGFISISCPWCRGKELIFVSSLLAGNNVFKLLKTDVVHYLGFGSWWSYMFDILFEASPIAHYDGSTRVNVMIIEKGEIYFTYAKDISTTETHVVLRRFSDGAEITLITLPYQYGSYWISYRRCAKNKLLFVIYYGDVRNGEGQYSPTNTRVRLVIVDLSSFTVTDLGEIATGTNGGNAYAFIDSNNVLHRILLKEEYLIKLYRESPTRVKIVTTKLNGVPVRLTLNVYKCNAYSAHDADRAQLLGQVRTGSDGVGYFEYDSELAVIYFEWARDDEGYASNFIAMGKPKYRALKYGEPDWYVA